MMLNMGKLFARSATPGLVVFSLLLIVFLFFGREFSHFAPSWVWALVLLGSCLGILSSLFRLPPVIVIGLVGALGISLLLDLTVRHSPDPFNVKAVQRFVGYVFIFLPFAMIEWTSMMAARYPKLRRFAPVVLFTFGGALLFAFWVSTDTLEHGCYLGLLGYLGLIGASRFDESKRMYFIPCLIFILGAVLGGSRGLIIATIGGLVVWLWQNYRQLAWYRRLTHLGFFFSGMTVSFLTGRAESFTRFKFTFLNFFQSLIGTANIGPNGLYDILPADDTTAATTNLLWRLLVWKDAFRTWLHSPLFGIGYREVFSSPSVHAAYPISTPAYEDLDLHNSWLQVLLRGGLFVFIPFVLYWAMAYRRLPRECRAFLVFLFLYSLSVVTFETPHYVLPLYIIMGFVPFLGVTQGARHRADKLSILLVSPQAPPFAGVERAAEQLCRVLAGSGFLKLEVLDTQIHRFNADKGKFSSKAVLTVFRQGAALIAKVWKTEPQAAVITISQNFSGLARDAFFLALLKAFGVRVIGWVHGASLPQYLKGSGAGSVFYRVLAWVDAWVVPSQELISPLDTLFPSRSVQCIPHSVDFARFAASGSADGKRWDFAFVGKVAASKGWNDFSETIEKMRAGGEPARIRIIGEVIREELNVPGLIGKKPERLDLLSKESYSAEASDLELGETYLQAKAVVIPSYSEAFCFVAAEAMACGSIVIGYRTVGLKFLLGPELQEYLVEVGDREGLERLMVQVLDLSNEKLAELGSRFHDRIHRLLDEKTIRNDWLRLLETQPEGFYSPMGYAIAMKNPGKSP